MYICTVFLEYITWLHNAYISVDDEAARVICYYTFIWTDAVAKSVIHIIKMAACVVAWAH